MEVSNRKVTNCLYACKGRDFMTILVSSFNGISSFEGYLTLNPYHKSISPTVNVIANLVIELIYLKVTVQYFS